MNEVAELTKLEIDKLDLQTGMLLDNLHKNALKNMYLEPLPILLRDQSQSQRRDHGLHLHQGKYT